MSALRRSPESLRGTFAVLPRLCWRCPLRPVCRHRFRRTVASRSSVVAQPARVLEFGGAPARDQLRKMPQDGPHADLLMLCRMLTARRGYVVPGGQRKVYSWTDWLGQAGLLTDGIRTSRGVAVMAKDGHLCRSLLERQIDDFFFEHDIPHHPEPHYPFDRHQPERLPRRLATTRRHLRRGPPASPPTPCTWLRRNARWPSPTCIRSPP